MLFKQLITGDRMGPMIARKGGGGGATSSSGYSAAIQGEVEDQFKKAGQALDQQVGNPSNVVAQQTGSQLQGLSAQEQLGRDALSGQGVFNNQAAVNRQLQNLQGQQTAQGLGSLGSARADRARQAALADQSLQMNQLNQQNAIAGAAGLQQAGAQRQAQDQRNLDADHEARSRYFGYLTNAPKQTTQSQSGGK